MKSLIQKDKKNRLIFKKLEHKKAIIKPILHNTNFSIILRWNSYEKLSRLTDKSSLSHLNNRCVLTGRKKRINKLYSFSRIMFLKLVRANDICGLKKSSW